MSVLKDIQTDAANRLLADPFFTHIPVLTENIGDIQNKIQVAISKLGVCVVVLTPTANLAAPDYPKPYFDKVKLVFTVVEQVVMNRSTRGLNIPASDVAEMVALLMQGYQPDAINEAVYLDVPSIRLVPNKTYLIYEVHCVTQAGIGGNTIVTVQTPVINEDSGVITLTCATPGAAIFYTVNNQPIPSNMPSPQVGTLYQGPFAVTAGKYVRCKAWLAGYVASLEAHATAGNSGEAPPSTYRLQLNAAGTWVTIGADSIPPAINLAGTNIRFVSGTGPQLLDDTDDLWHTIAVFGVPPQLFIDPVGSP